MPTTFTWLYLGTGPSIDPTEGNATAENASALVGIVYGTTAAPIYNNRTSVTTINNGGNTTALDMDNLVANDQFTSNIGAGTQTFTFDGTAIYNATLTYADGTTAVISAVIAQSTTGELFLAPEFTANADTAAQEFRPIVSIRLDSLVGNVYSGLTANRVLTGFDDAIVEGTAGNDLINGSYVEALEFGSDRIDNGDGGVGVGANDDVVRAGAGNDTVLAGIGDDTVYGGTGNDSLSGEAGNDQLFGEAGLDTLFGGDGNDSLFGGDDADLIEGGDGNDLIYGGTGNDIINFGNGNDTVYGGDGDDLIDDIAGSNLTGANLIYGEAGNDTVWTGFGDDTIYGGAGDDLLSGEGDADLIYGDGGFDTLFGGDGNDSLFGGDDDDSLLGGVGNDALSGDAGNDTLSGEDGDDTLFGGAGADRLFGGAGNDVLYGGDGPDYLEGGAGQDTIFGGIGDTVDGGSTGIDLDVLDLTAWGKAQTNIIFDPLNPENGSVQFLDAFGAIIGTMSFTDIETVIPCFTPGSMVATERGDIAVEHLRESDMVLTRDNGYQPIRWVGRRDLTVLELFLHETLRPVMIRKGALGPDMPARDMMVSPQHRMLIEGATAEMYFGEAEVLVAATHMVGQVGIERAFPKGVSYLHLLFDHHEILCVDGVWTESLQPAQRMLEAMEATDRHEIELLFGDLSEKVVAFPAARRSLKAHEARVLLAA